MWDELRYRWRLRQYLKSRPVVSSSTTNVAGSPDGMGPLLDDGLPVVTLQQGWVTQSPALN
jgi:hypothetical protein